MKKILFFCCTCLLLAAPGFSPRIFAPRVFAQTAAEIENLLTTSAVTYEQAASFVLRAADIPVSGRAFEYAAKQKWLSAKAAPGGKAILKEVSGLIMGAFNMKGGIMYSDSKSPRYAYRELVYQGIIQGRADPDQLVSGDRLMFMVGKVLSRIEGEL